MTNHTEISKKLALAIGWKQTNIQEFSTKLWVLEVWSNHHWRAFDYRDPAVIWPIAKRYSLFPSGVSNGDYAAAEKLGHGISSCWERLRWHYEKSNGKARGWVRYEADTPELAVALAVIGGAG